MITIALSLLLVGAGCATRSADVSAPATTPQRAAGAKTHAASAVDDPARVVFDDSTVNPGKTDLRFEVRAADGLALTPDNLKVAHERLMHFLLVRDDLTGYQHLHPEFDGERWTVTTDTLAMGTHYAYVDVVPKTGEPVVMLARLTVGGPTAKKAFPEPQPDLTATDGSHVAKMTIAAGGALSFALTSGGKPSADIKPYLGAYGHAVMMKHDGPTEFRHLHPDEDGVPPANGVIRFAAELPKGGMWTVFAQFDVGGKVRTFPITLVFEGTGADDGAMEHMGH
jgi:hypothetical protein